MIPAWFAAMEAAILGGMVVTALIVLDRVERRYAAERRDLLNRLMARDLSDYQAVSEQPTAQDAAPSEARVEAQIRRAKEDAAAAAARAYSSAEPE